LNEIGREMGNGNRSGRRLGEGARTKGGEEGKVDRKNPIKLT